MQRALVQIQIQLPASQDIVVHIVHHLASGIKVPPFASSMWPFERAWKSYIDGCHGTRFPHISIMYDNRDQRLAGTCVLSLPTNLIKRR